MTEKKSQAESEIEALADVFNIATEGFEGFYKKANESKKGSSSTAASSGEYSTAASSGEHSKAASSGYCSTAASSGEHSACTAVGYRAAVKGDLGNLLMASEYAEKSGKYVPVGGKADLVDGKKIKPNCWYIVENGEWVQVDFSDGIFGRVISTRQNVKKIKTDSGRIVYVASNADGDTAHADTIAEALHELAFKVGSRDVSQFQNMPMNTKKTPQEWALVYRMVTGACQYGTSSFMESEDLLQALNNALGQGPYCELTGEEVRACIDALTPTPSAELENQLLEIMIEARDNARREALGAPLVPGLFRPNVRAYAERILALIQPPQAGEVEVIKVSDLRYNRADDDLGNGLCHHHQDQSLHARVAIKCKVSKSIVAEIASELIHEMGWPEIDEFHKEMRKGQLYDDAGGYFLRGIGKLIGKPSRYDELTRAKRAMLKIATPPAAGDER